MQLNDKVEHFLTPLGVGDTLIKWGIPAEKVQQLDWWDTTCRWTRTGGYPAHHFQAVEWVIAMRRFGRRG